MSERHLKGIVLTAVVIGDKVETAIKTVSDTAESVILNITFPYDIKDPATFRETGEEVSLVISDVPIDFEKRNKERKQNEQNEQN